MYDILAVSWKDLTACLPCHKSMTRNLMHAGKAGRGLQTVTDWTILLRTAACILMDGYSILCILMDGLYAQNAWRQNCRARPITST